MLNLALKLQVLKLTKLQSSAKNVNMLLLASANKEISDNQQ